MSQVTSVIVFGPTGKTGLQCLKRGILEGLEVTAYVRRPNLIPAQITSKLFKVMQGDVLDKDRVENAIEGHDAVISALGTGWNLRKTNVMSQGIKNIISGMEKHSVTKLVVISDVLLLPSFRWHPLNLILWNVLQDHRRQMDILENNAKSLEWTAIMPPRIKKSDKIHKYKVAVERLPGSQSVTTADLGDFAVKVLTDPRKGERYIRCKVGISSHPKFSFSWLTILVLLIAITIGVFIYYNGIPPALTELTDVILGNYEKTPGNETQHVEIHPEEEMEDSFNEPGV